MKYVSVKSIVMIIAITSSGSQAWAKDWTTAKACDDQVIKDQKQAACREPIKATSTPEDVEYRVVFDFNTNGCLPSAGVSEEKDKEGNVVYKPNPGIAIGGDLDGCCAYRDQINKSNTMYRIRCINSDGNDYCVRRFALYFVKDQLSLGPASGGHTNDWEFGLMWTKNQQVTHASYSAHGHVYTKPIENLYKDPIKLAQALIKLKWLPQWIDGKEKNVVYMNYYCPVSTAISCGNTHSMILLDEMSWQI
jgi:Necrosis inducing protein (NPP1)